MPKYLSSFSEEKPNQKIRVCVVQILVGRPKDSNMSHLGEYVNTSTIWPVTDGRRHKKFSNGYNKLDTSATKEYC